MPFSQPPVPSTFTIGDPNAGHVTFDSGGQTFYGPDGVTVLFRLNNTNGNMFLGGQLDLDLNDNPVGVPALGNGVIFLFMSDATPARQPIMLVGGASYPHVGNVGPSISFYGDSFDNTKGSKLVFSAKAWEMQNTQDVLLSPFGPTFLHGGRLNLEQNLHGQRLTDGVLGLIPVCYNAGVTQGQDIGSATATVGAGGAANFNHNLGASGNSMWIEADSGTLAWQHRLSSTSSTGFSLVCRDNVGAVLASGVSTTVRYGILG